MRALVLNQENGKTLAAVTEISDEQLPQSDVTVKVHYSGINYKDALAITGFGKIVRNFPMVPGIDFVGEVVSSRSDKFTPGDKVLLTGWGVGENHWGGLAEFACVPANYLTPLPKNLTAEQAMTIGTAGFTAMLCVNALIEAGIKTTDGDIVVTGASGGVGSTAVALLSALGYSVLAISGRADNHEYLKSLGASEVLARSDFDTAGRPLEKQRFIGAIDTVGGEILANVLAQMHYNGCVAACGLAASYKLPTTVMPFILRNVRLQGVDSVMVPTEKRDIVWQQLADWLPASFYQDASKTISLEEAPQAAFDLFEGKITGRTVVKVC